MASQLLPISALYIIFQFPPMFLYAAYSAGLSRNTAREYYGDALVLSYWVILFTPFVSVLSMSELRTKLRKIVLFWRVRRDINPAMFSTTGRNVGRGTSVAVVVP